MTRSLLAYAPKTRFVLSLGHGLPGKAFSGANCRTGAGIPCLCANARPWCGRDARPAEKEA